MAQVIIVAESDTKGGTWEGANGALKQKRSLYVRKFESLDASSGNKLLLDKGGHPLDWPVKDLDDLLLPLVQKGAVVHTKHRIDSAPPSQLSLLAVQAE